MYLKSSCGRSVEKAVGDNVKTIFVFTFSPSVLSTRSARSSTDIKITIIIFQENDPET